MPRFRVHFAKGDGVKFISHLDMIKTFERAIRRGRIPIAFSEGFNPHPKLSFASALRVGVTSEAEYMDVELTQAMEPLVLGATLGRALPPGFPVLAVREVPLSAPAAMAIAAIARYRLNLRLTAVCRPEDILAMIEKFEGSETIPVERITSKGKKTIDIRPLTRRLQFIALNGTQLILEADLAMGPAGTGRPEEIGQVLSVRWGLPLDGEAGQIHRTGLFAVGEDGSLRSLWDA